jgi:hypothetical protein
VEDDIDAMWIELIECAFHARRWRRRRLCPLIRRGSVRRSRRLLRTRCALAGRCLRCRLSRQPYRKRAGKPKNPANSTHSNHTIIVMRLPGSRPSTVMRALHKCGCSVLARQLG